MTDAFSHEQFAVHKTFSSGGCIQHSRQINGLDAAVRDVVRHEHDLSVVGDHVDLTRLRNIAADLFRVPASRVGIIINGGAVQFCDKQQLRQTTAGPLRMFVAAPSTPDTSRVYMMQFSPFTVAVRLSASIVQDMLTWGDKGIF
jgi:hypothetical protein